MSLHFCHAVGWATILVMAAGLQPVRAGFPTSGEDSPSPRKAVAKGLDFLQKDAAKWRKDHGCATCHHGTMTVWALVEAKTLGYAIKPDNLVDTVKWTKDRLLERIDLPRDTRPGWSMVSTPAIYLSVMALCVPNQKAVTPVELRRIAGHLLRHQEKDGSWAWSSAPAQNRPPPFFESDEVATMLAFIALGSHEKGNRQKKEEFQKALKLAAGWLAMNKPGDSTQEIAFRLLLEFAENGHAKKDNPQIRKIMDRQNRDGGWGQLKGAASDAYATGQVLYILGLAGVKSETREIQRGVKFLVQSQNQDGSWPMTRRGHPGVNPSKNHVPIIYFGSAWGTIGLMRSIPR